jgi:hypothetical protein
MKLLMYILVSLICVSGIAQTNSEVKADYTLTKREAIF